jgi:hypothetical protein
MTLKSSVLAFSVLAGLSTSVLAAESASGAYLLGLRGQGAGITAPEGVFFSNQVYYYDASAAANIKLEGGSVAVGVKAQPIVDIPTLLWVTPAEIVGGKLGFTATAPFGNMDISAKVLGVGVREDLTTFADPSVGAFLGWKDGNLHWQAGVTGFLPIGDYREGALANVAKHRLAADVYGAITYFDPESGIDLSNIVGVTFNAENSATNYKTGTEFHWEGSLTKKFTPAFSAGIIGYHYNQLTADSGAGATLGDFKGQISAVGATVGYDFVVGKTPVSTRLRYYHEFAARNRLEGDAVFASMSFPLALTGQ